MNKKLLREYVRIILRENYETETDEIDDIDNIDAIVDIVDADDQYQKPKSNRAEKILFKKEFLAKYTDFKPMTARAEGDREVRVGPKNPAADVNDEDISSMFQEMGYTVEQEILPGQPGTKTTKYKTWLISRAGYPSFSVVFGSANKGEKFESALWAELVNMFGETPPEDSTQPSAGHVLPHQTPTPGPSLLGDELIAALGITHAQVISVDARLPARGRPLTGEITNVGKEISDITLKVKPSKKYPAGIIYISLKDPNGGTFANNGLAGMFVETPAGFMSNPAGHNLDSFVKALGIVKRHVALGASDYKLMRDTLPEELCSVVTPAAFDAQIISNYLASALGFGYVYARKMNAGSYHIEELKTAEDAMKLVGTPTSVKIVYARFCNTGQSKSKGTRAMIETDNGAKYEVAIRNKSGKIIPNQMTISIKRYPTK
jgi:hypothetical protein